MKSNWKLRLACEKDIPAIEVLIPLSVRTLQAAHYSPAQMEAALSGEPLYASFDYAVIERYEVPIADGQTLPVVRMTKQLIAD